MMKRIALSTLAAASLLVPATTYAMQSNLNSSEVRAESTTLLAQAQTTPSQRGNGQNGRQGDGRPMGRMLQQLDLSSEQSARIEAIFQQSRTQNESLREQMQQAREQMKSLMAGNASADQLRQQHNAMQSLHQQMANRRFETMLSVREVLTPQQRARWAELKDSQGPGRGRGR